MGRQLQRRVGQHALDDDEPLSRISRRSCSRRCRSTSASRCCATSAWTACGSRCILSEKNREISDVQFEQTVATTARAGAQRVLGPGVRERVARRAAAVARPGATSRCARPTRESRSASRRPLTPSRREAEVAHARGGGDRRAGADRNRAGCAARARLQPVVGLISGPRKSSLRICRCFEPVTVDVDGAVSNALQMRTDLLQARKSLEENDINIRYFRNQTLPDVTAQLRLRPDGPRRHAVRARHRLSGPDHRPDAAQLWLGRSATCSPTSSRAGRSRSTSATRSATASRRPASARAQLPEQPGGRRS